MKTFLFLIALFCALKTNAQNYLITFAGTGASTTVNSVKVENLTAGTSIILNGDDILSLSITTGINSVENINSTELKIYPNPMTVSSILRIYPPEAGSAVITVLNLSGKTVFQNQQYLENDPQEFRLSGLSRGYYIVNVKGSTYQYSVKVICNSMTSDKIRLEKISSNQSVAENPKKVNSKGIQVTVDMVYTIGDRLKFTGISGNYSIVITDIPTGDMMITFDFVACTDADNINYPGVKIGTQVWMAENLKTTKFNNGDLIGTTTTADKDISAESSPEYQWAYEGIEDNIAEYGRLYTWYSVTDSRNICPSGWHVPTDAEWHTMVLYLDIDAVLSSPESWRVGGKLKETGMIHWTTPNTAATNETGFAARAGGYRASMGVYLFLKEDGYWWSSSESSTTQAWSRWISSMGPNIYSLSLIDRRNLDDKKFGLAVRCVKN
jgi:uncharacterized protein (TIGR02145 family)